jgi:hypothetical protein
MSSPKGFKLESDKLWFDFAFHEIILSLVKEKYLKTLKY